MKSVTRLGKPLRNEQGMLKPRPILSNEMSKKNVLKRASMIRQRESEFHDCKNVFITPDHTILERKQDVKLREQLKRKRAIDPNWMIKGGRLARKPPQPNLEEDQSQQGEQE